MKRILTLMVPSVLVLCGCNPSTLFEVDPAPTLETDSGQITVGSDGSMSSTLDEVLTGSDVELGDGYGYVIGVDAGSTLVEAYAGVANTTSLGTQPIEGSATMTGNYEVGQYDNLRLDDDDNPIGTTTTDPGEITLTADFVGLTLTGTDNDLTVNGVMEDGVLSGTVNYDGLDGTLVGEIGPSSAVGSFSGSDANTVFAGGFHVEE